MKDWWLAIMMAGFLNVSLVTLMCSLRTNVVQNRLLLIENGGLYDRRAELSLL